MTRRHREVPMKNTLPAEELFAVLEQAFRRRARECSGCAFTLPFHVARSRAGANWSVAATAACSEKCRLVLEDLIAEHQAAYELATRGGAPETRKRTSSRAH